MVLIIAAALMPNLLVNNRFPEIIKTNAIVAPVTSTLTIFFPPKYAENKVNIANINIPGSNKRKGMCMMEKLVPKTYLNPNFPKRAASITSKINSCISSLDMIKMFFLMVSSFNPSAVCGKITLASI